MTVRTTLSFTDRHHKFIMRQVEEGIYASQSAMVADAIETLIQQRDMREAALIAMTDEIRARFATPRDQFVSEVEAFAGLGLDDNDETA